MNKINQARASRIYLSLGATAALGILLGCGEIGGAGQCNGVDVTGMCVTLDSIQPVNVQGENTNDVDIFQDPDCDGDPETFDPEPFGSHGATVTISANLMPGVTSPPAPGFVTWEKYTVEYDPSPTNINFAPPLNIQEFGETIKVNADSSTESTLEMMPLPIKEQYVIDSGGFETTSYTVIYTFTGKTQFNQEIALKGSTSIIVGAFANCGS